MLPTPARSRESTRRRIRLPFSDHAATISAKRLPTGLGPELLLRLDRTQSEPLRSQLEQQLRHAIRSGRLRADERLPSSRALAIELGVSRGLVLDCYRQLQAEGYLSSRGGSATRVAAAAQPPRPPSLCQRRAHLSCRRSDWPSISCPACPI